jgi:DNA-binding LytR/AlgR family response regulator
MTQLPDSMLIQTSTTRYDRLRLADLLYAEATSTGVQLVLKQRTYTLKTNIGTIEAQLPAMMFKRTSRQHVVNLTLIEYYEAGYLCLVGEHRVPLGPQYRQPLLAQWPILRMKLTNRQ